MTAMTAKQFLRHIRWLDSVIDAKLEDLDKLRSRAEKITSSPPSLDRVVATFEQDRLSAAVAKMVDHMTEINDSIDELIDLKRQANEIIEQLKDNRYRVILHRYYFNRATFEQIAVDMDYTYQWVCILHGRALQEFEKHWKS